MGDGAADGHIPEQTGIAKTVADSNDEDEASVAVVAICGGTGSGKSTLTRAVQDELDVPAVHLELDNFYKDMTQLDPDYPERVKWDHPQSFDWQVVESVLQNLSEFREAYVPEYDYETAERVTGDVVQPAPVVLFDGLYTLHESSVREYVDYGAYVQTDPDVRLIRRARRDIEERGETIEDVFSKWAASARPMHERFVEPQMFYADEVFDGEADVDHQADVIARNVEVDTNEV